MKTATTIRSIAALALLAAIGCGDAAGPDGDANVRVMFAVTGTSVAPSSPASFSVTGTGDAADLSFEGTNGTLEISEIHLIVEELELELADDDACEDSEGVSDDCDEFEQRYLFIEIPVDGSAITVTADNVPAGVYDEFELEIEDIEVDDDPEEEEDAALIAALLAEVRAEFPEWPEEASMVVIGTFTPTDGAAEDFTTYFEAEIEIEMELDPPLEVVDGASLDLTINLDPAEWFELPDGTVLDLSALQDELVEFELEFEDGFEIEYEDDD
jgi:hypothetical protein